MLHTVFMDNAQSSHQRQLSAYHLAHPIDRPGDDYTADDDESSERVRGRGQNALLILRVDQICSGCLFHYCFFLSLSILFQTS